jgi:chromosomal replication initiation ATPase DnaA
MTNRREDRSRQIPLDLRHPVAQSRDDLVVTPANRDAVALVDTWPHWPAPVAVLVGPAGSGKSHLAAIWRELAGADPIDAGGASGPLADAVAPHPLLLEDADAGGLDEIALFHRINSVRAGASQMLITARRPPSTWPIDLPDLASRLRAATVVTLAEPDDLLLAGVMAKLFADRQVQVEPAVARYLVKRIERSLAAVSAAVERLDRLALERRAPITRALAAEVLPDMGDGEAEPE